MGYTDDWENLMNGVFGPGGKLRFDTQKTPPEKPGLPDMNAALIEQQKKLDEMLKKQNAELSQSLSEAQSESVLKRMKDLQLQRDYNEAIATLDRIPPEVLKAYTNGTKQTKREVDRDSVR